MKHNPMKTGRIIPLTLVFLTLLAPTVPAATLYVDLNCPNPTPPFADWTTAATNIQIAIDAASAGDTVLVTNGIFTLSNSGGRMMDGHLTNLVVINKAITVQSVNGPSYTTIQCPGVGNSIRSVRCVWLTNNATLMGFTLTGGGTRSGTGTTYDTGGGVWGSSTNASVVNCLIISNYAWFQGGGAYRVALNNCVIQSNRCSNDISPTDHPYGCGASSCNLSNCVLKQNFTYAQDVLGVGAYNSYLQNCAIIQNIGGIKGSAIYGGSLLNCTVYSNTYVTTAVDSAKLTNCIVWGNGGSVATTNCTVAYSDTDSPVSGAGNISANPQLLGDGYHVAVASPCFGAGTNLAMGTDIDFEAWANPPSMGVDEPVAANLVGPLSVSLSMISNVYAMRPLSLTGLTTGSASRVSWDFGDGSTATNVGAFTSHTWTNTGSYTVTFTAYNLDNPGGMLASNVLNVLSINVPQIQTSTLVSNKFQVQYYGQSNVTYSLLRATNLVAPVTWQMIGFSGTPATDGVVQKTDSAPTNAAAFYRLRAQ
jgi:hypothetical protein